MVTTKGSFGYAAAPAGTIRVVMLIHISGTRNGADWPEVGGEITLSAEEAVQLIRNGDAYPAPSFPAHEPEELAVIASDAPERAVVSRARPPRRR